MNDLIGKRFKIDGEIFTVYSVVGVGVFAHKGDYLKVDENGEVIEPRYFEISVVEENLLTPGRPVIGETRKVSLTLDKETWKEIDLLRKQLGGISQSKLLRKMVEAYLER